MKKTFEYNLPLKVIKFLSNVASINVFGESLTSIDGIVSLNDYNQSEIKRCYSDFMSFMTNAKDNGRKVSVLT